MVINTLTALQYISETDATAQHAHSLSILLWPRVLVMRDSGNQCILFLLASVCSIHNQAQVIYVLLGQHNHLISRGCAWQHSYVGAVRHLAVPHIQSTPRSYP